MFDVPERILIRFQDKCLYHYWKDSVVHVAYQFCLVMVFSLHGPLFCNVYPFEFDYSNLEVSEKEQKLSLNFVSLQMLEKDNIFWC